MGLTFITSSVVFAKPERLEIDTPSKRTAKLAAKQALKAVDVQAIEDPEAREAIKQILNYLNLQSGK